MDQTAHTAIVGRTVRTATLWWALGIVLLLVGGTALTITVRQSELLPGEVSVTRWLFEHDYWWLDIISDPLDWVSNFRVAPVVFALLVPAVLYVWGRYAALIFFISGGLTGLSKLVDLASRPRPGEDLIWSEISHGRGGYPSGHVVYGVLVFGMLAYLAYREMAPSWRRTFAVSFFVGVTVLMGPSRIIELDHWPADIVGAYLLSVPFLIALTLAYPRLPGWASAVRARGRVARTRLSS